MAQYELNVLDYWLIVRKRKYTIALTALLVVTFTVVIAQFLRPVPVYEATARVKFDRASTVANLLLESLSTQSGSDIGTQSEVVKSFPVIEQVAQQLGLVPKDAPPETRRSEAYLTVVYGLQGQVKAVQEGGTAIIKIAASAGSGELAQRLANGVAEAYRLENIKTQNRMVTDSRRFVEEQMAALLQKLKTAEDALLNFKQREGQVFLDEEAKAALAAYSALDAEHNAVLRRQEEVLKQIANLESHDGQAEKSEEHVFAEEPTTLLAVLNSRLHDLRQERANLLVNYTGQHPNVREVNRKISAIKVSLVHELESKVKNLRTRERALREQMERYRERYISFPKSALEQARLERDVKVTSDLHAALSAKHQELLVKSAQQIEEVTLIEPAVTPAVPVNKPDYGLNIVVGVMMGMVLGVVLAFARESFDTSIGTIEGVEEFLGAPVLGVIPQFDEAAVRESVLEQSPPGSSKEAIDMMVKLACLFDSKSVLAESYRALRTNIEFSSANKDIKTVLFTSAGLGEGKTTTIANVAIALAQDGKRVVLIDADLRRPVVHARFGLQREPGLAEVLIGNVALEDAIRTITDLMIGTLGVDRVMNSPGLDNLHLLPSGAIPPNPAELLNSSRLTQVISDLRKQYDVVLFDTPPILPISDAVMMSSKVDGVVLVYQVGRIGRNALKRTKFLIDHAQGHILGTVLTNVRSEITPEYGYYRYEYK
jgi:succinoglycan biosynthesis transport protein ExoP